MSLDHPDPALGTALLLETVGSTSVPFLSGLMGDLGHIAQRGQDIDAEQLNFALSVIQGIEPQDQLETMLASQMAANQSAIMSATFKLNASTDPKRWEIYERSLNRLARTFAAQMEALKRYRSKGEQRVYVERVNVESGGQAVVGLVERGGGVSENPAVNAMNLAPRCKATSKRTGVRCQAPAVRGKRVCRCHGAHAGAPRGSAHGRYVHGQRTIQAQAERLSGRLLLSEAGGLLAAMLQAR